MCNLIKNCPKCWYKSKRANELKLGLLLILGILLSPFVLAVNGSSTFFNLQPNCSINGTFVDNCTQQTIKLNCFEPSPQFVSFMVFNLNTTSYIAQQQSPPNQ